MSRGYFYAIGQQYASRGIVFARIGAQPSWPGMPDWAIESVMEGNSDQGGTSYRRFMQELKSKPSSRAKK